MKETLTRGSLMISFIISVGAILILGFAGSGVKTHDHIAFINGQVFNGDAFVKKNIYSINRVITFQKPMSVDTVVDVEGKFIIPPFREAHNHNLGNESNIKKQLDMYLSQGVFY